MLTGTEQLNMPKSWIKTESCVNYRNISRQKKRTIKETMEGQSHFWRQDRSSVLSLYWYRWRRWYFGVSMLFLWGSQPHSTCYPSPAPRNLKILHPCKAFNGLLHLPVQLILCLVRLFKATLALRKHVHEWYFHSNSHRRIAAVRSILCFDYILL